MNQRAPGILGMVLGTRRIEVSAQQDTSNPGFYVIARVPPRVPGTCARAW
jgi:hypothetical protein